MVAIPLVAAPLGPPLAQSLVLVLEDDAAVAATICSALAREGWATVTAGSLAEARKRLHEDHPRLIVADLGLPDGNGIAFVREAAASGDLGIIVVSGRGEEVDRIIGLEVGADDYLTKPFSLREMVARLRALNRRLDATSPRPLPLAAPQASLLEPAGGLPQRPGYALEAPPAARALPSGAAEAAMALAVAEPSSWCIEGTRLQPSRFLMIGVDGKEIRLTGGEAGLLTLLLTEPENMADRELISRRVLGRRLLPEQRGVDQLASNLRHKLLAASAGRITITALRGKGYRLVW
ncbi:response regulator transcription factor [Falsiroseomonas tokyonensis]|uniref:Response regulator n=1 Tax=Falsiroseomonas tokyonensis TaxID=430521 RepID=A0ABV7BV85_9PROT|nr:response regulator transcription factor [Falsiroseomonas tokyonensis]MBU8538747.1 response regulator transcription factor [Falsiroseomonas tokyonensis]